MQGKRNNVGLIIGVATLLLCLPFRVTATDYYCAQQEIQLPYPGMLSNHPLYVIKKIRDRILEQFITQSNKRLEYYLYESNKYFAEMLIQKQAKNDAYVISSGLRSGNFFTLFISKYNQIALSDTSIQKKLICDFYSGIEFQILKYHEIIANMQDGEQKKQLVQIVEQLKQNKDGFDNLLTTMNSKRIPYE